MDREDLIALIIGAEIGIAIGVLFFGSVPLLPILVALVCAGLGPVALRGWRPLRLVLFRHWFRAQVRSR